MLVLLGFEAGVDHCGCSRVMLEVGGRVTGCPELEDGHDASWWVKGVGRRAAGG